LRDAIVVNPYDIDELAHAIKFALVIYPTERSARMHRSNPSLARTPVPDEFVLADLSRQQ